MHINDGMKGYGSVVEDGPTGNNCSGGDRSSSGNHGKPSPSDEPVLHRPLILSMKNQNHSATHHTTGTLFPPSHLHSSSASGGNSRGDPPSHHVNPPVVSGVPMGHHYHYGHGYDMSSIPTQVLNHI